MDKPLPKPVAMIICDTVISDKKTNKKSLIGIFNGIAATKTPFQHPSLNVFISLMDGIGDYEGRLKCTYMNENKEILDLGCPISFKQRLQTVEFHFELFNISFPGFGTYTFDLFCDENHLISRKFMVNEKAKN